MARYQITEIDLVHKAGNNRNDAHGSRGGQKRGDSEIQHRSAGSDGNEDKDINSAASYVYFLFLQTVNDNRLYRAT